MAIVWFFQPIAGLAIDHKGHSPEEPLFGVDGTLLQESDLEAFLAAKGVDVTPETRHSIVRLLLSRACSIGVLNEKSQVLAVRGYGNSNDLAIQDAQTRAHRIANVLTFLTLVRSDFQEACCLPEAITVEAEFRTFVVSPPDRCFRQSETNGNRAYKTRVPSPPLCVHWKELSHIISEPPFSDLIHITMDSQSDTKGNAKSRIQIALNSLVTSASAIQPEHQLVGAITCLETLLTTSHTNYDIIQSRLQILVGSKAFERLRIEDLIKQRHDIVHAGKTTTANMVHQAISAAAVTLLAYCRIARKFKSAGAILEYLDFYSAIFKINLKSKNFGVPVNFDEIAIPLPDLFPYRLLRHLYSRSQAQNFSQEAARMAFATVTLSYATSRREPVPEAFATMRRALTGVPCPFTDVDDFLIYARDNQSTLVNTTTNALKYIDEFVWTDDLPTPPDSIKS